MKTKRKISITSICLVLSILMFSTSIIFAVWAALNPVLNIGGNVVFSADNVYATVSQGVLSGGSLEDASSKMLAITYSANEDEDTSENASTWSGLELSFSDDGSDFTITFTITNLHTVYGLKSTVSVTYSSAENATITVSPTGSATLSANTSGSPDSVTYTLTFSVEDKNSPASITGFNIAVSLVSNVFSPTDALTTLTKKSSNLYIKYGDCVWTDGVDYYYSFIEGNYILDIDTFTWSEMTWYGCDEFYGNDIWTDGINYYYSCEDAQYVLDVENHTWSVMSWNIYIQDGMYVWTDGKYYYYSNVSDQYILNVDTHTWVEWTWNKNNPDDGSYVWTDGTNYYYTDYTDGGTTYVFS